jgi:HK97 family phage major capsid protein
MPDCAPGSTPVMFGNLNAGYLLVTRRGLTMATDPYTAGWCVLYKFDQRIGGAPTCPNALRLLRVR